MERALCFNLSFARELGVVSSAEEVARRGVEAVIHGDAECTPGLLNSIFATLPAFASRPIARAMFADAPWLSGVGKGVPALAAVAAVQLAPQPALAASLADE